MTLQHRPLAQQEADFETGPLAPAPAMFEQEHGNAAIADGLGLGLGETSDDPWSDAAIADWAFGPEKEEQEEVEGGRSSATSLLGDVRAGAPLGAPTMDPREAGRLVGIGRGEEQEAGGAVPAEVVAWVDSCLPVGIGFAGSLELSVCFGLSVASAGTISVVNLGGGWLEVTGTLEGLVGGEAGLGAVVADTGAEAGLDVAFGPKVSRTFRVPWTRLADAGTVAKLAAGAILGEAYGSMAEILMDCLGRHEDLGEFLTSERMEVSASGGLGCGGGLHGEEIDAAVRDKTGVALTVSYEGLADDLGKRKGNVRFEGYEEFVIEVACDLSKTLGVDSSCVLPELAGNCALVVPFDEVDGDKTFGMPWVEIVAGGKVGAVGAVGTIAVGPDHATVSVKGTIDPGSVFWQQVLDDPIGRVIEVVTLGVVELETEGSMTLSLDLPLDDLETSVLAPDVFAWLTTGTTSPALDSQPGLLERLLSDADAKLGVDLTIAALHADGGVDVKLGAVGSAEGDARVGLVYRREDILPEMASMPTMDELLAILRDPASLVRGSAGSAGAYVPTAPGTAPYVPEQARRGVVSSPEER